MKIIDVLEQLMRTILITGGAKRIGKSIAEELGYESNRILIHYNNSDVDAKKLQNRTILSICWIKLQKMLDKI